MRVAIVGPGAIGLGVASSVARAGHRVVLYGRRTAGGFDHTFEGTTEHHAVPIRADPGPVEPADWVLLCTKAYQTQAAAPWLDRLAGPRAGLAVVQNGVDHRARVADLWSGDVLPVVVSMPCARTTPTSVVQRRTGTMIVPVGARAASFAGLFDDRVTVSATDDFVTAAWTKLLTNATVGACAVLGAVNGAVLTGPLRELGEGMVREAVAVAQAEGAAFDDVEAMVAKTLATIAKSPEHRSSITEDRRAGRPMEWDARNQVVVRTAARHGIPVPLNTAVAALLATADASP
ncbi:MAG: 2-dehydropantoate 2-reductase [Myxococcota bacterium]